VDWEGCAGCISSKVGLFGQSTWELGESKKCKKKSKKSIQHQLFASAHAPDYLSWPLSGYLRRAERDPDLSAHVWPNAKSRTPRTQILEQISANPHRLWQKIAIFRENLRFSAHWRVVGGAGVFGCVPGSHPRRKIKVVTCCSCILAQQLSMFVDAQFHSQIKLCGAK
jgi:hypothetical protein